MVLANIKITFLMSLNFNAPEYREKKIPALDLDCTAQTMPLFLLPGTGTFSNSTLVLKLPAQLRQRRDGSEVLTGPYCDSGSRRMSEPLHLLFYNKNWVTGKTGLWFLNQKKTPQPAEMDEGFGLCVFFKLKLCSWICTKALTVKPFVIQASDAPLKKKKKNPPRVGWGESFSKVTLSKRTKKTQQSRRNFKSRFTNNVSNPIQLCLPYTPRGD